MKWDFKSKLMGKSKFPSLESKQFIHGIDELTSDTKVLLERAKVKAKSKNFEGAIEDINSILKLNLANMDTINAYMERSRIRKILKDEMGSKEDFDYAGVLLDNLDSGLKAHEMGLATFNASDYKNAINFFTEAISLNVEFAQTYHLRGLSKNYLDEYLEAVKDYNKAIEIGSEYQELFEVYFDRGSIKFRKLNDTVGALYDFNKAIQLNPKESYIYVSRARLLNSINEFESSMKDYNRAIELNSKDAETYFSRALLHFKLDNFLEAIKDLDIVIKLGLTDNDSVSMFNAYTTRGSLKILTKKFKDAIKDFNKALEIDPNDGRTYFDRSEAWLFLENYKNAAEDKIKAKSLGYEEEN